MRAGLNKRWVIRLRFFSMILLSGVLTLSAMNCFFIVQDDAYITFSYSRNLFLNGELSFNVGERVEGYTSFSWALINVIPLLLKTDIVVFSKIVGYISALLTLWIIFFYGFTFFRRWPLVFFPLLVFVFSDYAVSLSQGGMETGFFYFLLISTNFRYAQESKKWGCKKFPVSAFLALGLVLTRPEGLLFSGCIIIDLFITVFLSRPGKIGSGSLPDTSRKEKRKYAVRWGLIFLGGTLGFFLFRWTYYHDIFPNTYYIKANIPFISLLRRFRPQYILYSLADPNRYYLFVREAPLSILYLTLIPFLLLGRPKHWNILATVLIGFLYVYLIGPDQFMAIRTPGGVLFGTTTRFLIFFYPVILLGAGLGLDRLLAAIGGRRKLGRLLSLLILLAIITGTGNFIREKNLRFLDPRTAWVNFHQFYISPWAHLSNYLIDYRLPFTIVDPDIGYTKYTVNCELIDPVGLTDRNVTRFLVQEKNPGGYLDSVKSRKPDFIFDPLLHHPNNLLLVLADKEFLSEYEKIHWPGPSPYDVYVNRDSPVPRRNLGEKIKHYQWIRTFIPRDSNTIHRLLKCYYTKAETDAWDNTDMVEVREIVNQNETRLYRDRGTWGEPMAARICGWALSITPRTGNFRYQEIDDRSAFGTSRADRINVVEGNYRISPERSPSIDGINPLVIDITSSRINLSLISKPITVRSNRDIEFKLWIRWSSSRIDCNLEVVFFNEKGEELLSSRALSSSREKDWTVLVFQGRTIPLTAYIQTRITISGSNAGGTADAGLVGVGKFIGKLELP